MNYWVNAIYYLNDLIISDQLLYSHCRKKDTYDYLRVLISLNRR